MPITILCREGHNSLSFSVIPNQMKKRERTTRKVSVRDDDDDDDDDDVDGP